MPSKTVSLFALLAFPFFLSLVNGSAAVTLYEDSFWRFEREFPYDYNVVFLSDAPDGRKQALDTGYQQRYEDYPLGIVANQRFLAYFSYDVKNSLPPGKLVGKKNVHFYLSLIRKENRQLSRVSISLPRSSIDSIPYLNLRGGLIDLCVDSYCATIDAENGSRRDWKNGFPEKLIEVEFDGSGGAFGIVRAGGSGYLVYYLNQHSIKLIDTVSDGVPYDLKVNGGDTSYSLAQSPGDYVNVYKYDLNRLGRGQTRGLLGESNLEGRVVWEKHYYLNAMLSSIETGAMPSKAEEQWLAVEMDEILDLCTDSFPSLSVRRYSLNRDPLLFALHVGLFSQLLERFENSVTLTESQKKEVSSCYQWVKRKLSSPGATIEELGHYIESATGNEVCCTLYYRKGAPFWADGSNVPLNYVSGKLIGLLIAKPPGFEKEVSQLSRMLITELVDNQSVELKGGWRYWMYRGWRGWTEIDGVSINSPNYRGKGDEIAHISYRSIDALALLSCAEQGLCDGVEKDDVIKKLVSHIDNRIVNLYLLEELDLRMAYLKFGDPNFKELVKISRSANRVELRESIWANYLLDLQ